MFAVIFRVVKANETRLNIDWVPENTVAIKGA